MSGVLSTLEQGGLRAWETKRARNFWSKNDTMRWLDTYAPGVTAWLTENRKELPRRPAHGEPHLGQFIKDRHPTVFSAVHGSLMAADRELRPNLTLKDVLP